VRVTLPPPGPRRDLYLALAFAIVAAAFRLPRLGFPPEEIFDEVYHAKAAWGYLHNEMPIEWVHPPTSKILIAVGVYFFGYDSWSWRLAPALAGIAIAPVFFLLARRVLATERAAVLATSLLLMDGVYLVQSRTAMTNIFAVLFQLAAALFIIRAALREELSAATMTWAGIFLGLALSTRWTSLWATGFLGLVLLVVRRERILRLRELALTALAFAVLPPCLYALSYWIVPVLRPRDLAHLIDTSKAIWHYHATLTAEHTYFSRWYTWPWLYRPTWYYYKQTDEAIRGIVALGNPALWWASVPVTLWALITGARDRDPRRLFTGSGFCALYLPWGVSPRTLNFSHYLFEALPYACLTLGALLDREWDGRWAPAVRTYLAFAVLLFLFFLPILAAWPIPPNLLFGGSGAQPWIWFQSWI
jgi:dolichyl-phosphate-mannose--protein O-mannosyl transferase